MKQAHIQLDDSLQARCALLPGDPKRVDIIKEYLTSIFNNIIKKSKY